MSLCPLLPHQKTGADFLTSKECVLLLDSPGVGKTFQTIAAADKVNAKRILVFCPALVRNHWILSFEQQQEIDRPIIAINSPDSVVPRTGTAVIIMSHASLVQKKHTVALQTADMFDVLIVDESAEFRRFEAIRTRNLLGDSGVWEKAKQCWFLTGTPIINSAMDVYPLVYGPLRRIYSPVPTWFEFASRFTNLQSDNFNGWKASGIREPDVLASMFRPFTVRRTLESAGIILPPLTIQNTPIMLPPAALTEVLAGLEGWTPNRLAAAIEDQGEVRDAAISRVRRALGIAKAPQVAEVVLRGDLPVVVFFIHTDVRNIIGQTLANAGLKIGYIDGTITKNQLTGAVNYFKHGAIDVLLVQIAAGGMGLTLTRGHRVVVAESPWTAAALFQAIKRVHRYTQTQPVTAEIIQAEGVWLEEVLARTIQSKHLASQSFLDLLTSE